MLSPCVSVVSFSAQQNSKRKRVCTFFSFPPFHRGSQHLILMRKYKKKKNRYRPNKVYPVKDMLIIMVNEELRPYNKTVDDIKGIEEWYNLYTFNTKSQEEVWKDYCNKLIRRHLNPWYIDKKHARMQLSWVALQIGLYPKYLKHEN